MNSEYFCNRILPNIFHYFAFDRIIQVARMISQTKTALMAFLLILQDISYGDSHKEK